MSDSRSGGSILWVVVARGVGRQHVSLKLRLNMLNNNNAIIFPTVLFGLTSLPLTKFHLRKLNILG